MVLVVVVVIAVSSYTSRIVGIPTYYRTFAGRSRAGRKLLLLSARLSFCAFVVYFLFHESFDRAWPVHGMGVGIVGQTRVSS